MKTIQKWKEDPNKLTNTRDPEIAADLPPFIRSRRTICLKFQEMIASTLAIVA